MTSRYFCRKINDMIKNIRIVLTFVFIFSGFTNAFSQSKTTHNKSITAMIAKKRAYNGNNGTGFRIQLYNGQENRARNILRNFKSKFPGTYTKLRYEQPDWKAQVGSYKSRLDADRALNKIREKFSGAIVIPL